jgi:hypothetical protein
MRRAGPILAAVFAAGLALGLIASTVFLAVGSSDLRTTMESRLADHPGPLGNVVLQRLNETGVVDDFASDARARHIRFVAVATLFGAAFAVTLSRSLAGWMLDKPRPQASTTARPGPTPP